MEIDEIKNEMNKIKWWHKIDLGNGIITPGKVETFQKLKRIGMPENLKGKTVLDVGTFNGFYSFEAEKRGAKRVLATDSFMWQKEETGARKGFNFAKKVLNSQIEEKEIDILDISPEKIGTFDLVLFLGVLYHMRHPLLALEKVASVTNEMAIIETETDMVEFDRPAIAFYPDKEFEDGPSTWVGPNIQAIEAMLKVAGFKKTKVYQQTPMNFRVTGIKGKNPSGYPPSQHIPSNRVTIHAWK